MLHQFRGDGLLVLEIPEVEAEGDPGFLGGDLLEREEVGFQLGDLSGIPGPEGEDVEFAKEVREGRFA